MTMLRTRRALALVAGVGVLALFAWLFAGAPAPGSISRKASLMLRFSMSAKEAERVMAESDSVRGMLRSDGVHEVGWEVLRRVREQQVSDEEIDAYLAEHPGFFGTRPRTACRRGVRRILQIRLTRESLADAALERGKASAVTEQTGALGQSR